MKLSIASDWCLFLNTFDECYIAAGYHNYLWDWVVQVLHNNGDISLCIDKLVNKAALAFHWPICDGARCVSHA